MFENKMVNGYVYYTRFIASFSKSGGDVHNRTLFGKWLKHLGLDKEDINGILFLADNGRLELEVDAERFLAENK